jgi:hypothetical protein
MKPAVLVRNEIVMRTASIVMGASHAGGNSAHMDVVAIVIGIAAFAILLFLIEGIDRV